MSKGIFANVACKGMKMESDCQSPGLLGGLDICKIRAGPLAQEFRAFDYC